MTVEQVAAIVHAADAGLALEQLEVLSQGEAVVVSRVREPALDRIAVLAERARALVTERELLLMDIEIVLDATQLLHEMRSALKRGLQKNLIKATIRLAYVTYGTIKSAKGLAGNYEKVLDTAAGEVRAALEACPDGFEAEVERLGQRADALEALAAAADELLRLPSTARIGIREHAVERFSALRRDRQLEALYRDRLDAVERTAVLP